MRLQPPRKPVGPFLTPEDRQAAWDRYQRAAERYERWCDYEEDERKDRKAEEGSVDQR